MLIKFAENLTLPLIVSQFGELDGIAWRDDSEFSQKLKLEIKWNIYHLTKVVPEQGTYLK